MPPPRRMSDARDTLAAPHSHGLRLDWCECAPSIPTHVMGLPQPLLSLSLNLLEAYVCLPV